MVALAAANVGLSWSVSVPAWLAWRVGAGVASAAVWIPLYAGLAKAFPDARTEVPRGRRNWVTRNCWAAWPTEERPDWSSFFSRRTGSGRNSLRSSPAVGREGGAAPKQGFLGASAQALAFHEGVAMVAYMAGPPCGAVLYARGGLRAAFLAFSAALLACVPPAAAALARCGSCADDAGASSASCQPPQPSRQACDVRREKVFTAPVGRKTSQE